MKNITNTKIILASQSPRRRELLIQAGYDFEVITSDIEEIITKSNPSEVVMELASQKAKAVFDSLISYADIPQTHEDDLNLLVIGSDTVVAKDNHIMGKPKDKNDAFSMLKSLQDKTHQVYTGVALYKYNFTNKTTDIITFYEGTDVTFYPMTDSEIYKYISTKDCYDKAGGYGIQGSFAIHVKKIDGDYNNVVGLPIARLYQEIKKL